MTLIGLPVLTVPDNDDDDDDDDDDSGDVDRCEPETKDDLEK